MLVAEYNSGVPGEVTVIADAVIEPLTLNEPVTNTSPFAE